MLRWIAALLPEGVDEAAGDRHACALLRDLYLDSAEIRENDRCWPIIYPL
jgi:hypothetical protein